MYEEIIDGAEASMYKNQAKNSACFEKQRGTCFVAGTLVWTDKGKVPIEQIKVGDMMLSKHENNTGEQSYKPVTRTFVYEDEVISLLHANSETVANTAPGAGSGPINDNFKKYGIWEHFICVTPSHPFYAKQMDLDSPAAASMALREGWTEAAQMAMGCAYRVQIIDGSYISAGIFRDFCRTEEDTIGWAKYERKSDSHGRIFNISPDCLAEVSEDNYYRGRPGLVYDPDWGWSVEMRATVYNIEVADFHTYYVGDLGFWVHNKNDPDGNVAFE